MGKEVLCELFQCELNKNMSKKLTKSSDLCVAGKFGKQNGLLTGVVRDFQLQPRFHVGDHR